MRCDAELNDASGKPWTHAPVISHGAPVTRVTFAYLANPLNSGWRRFVFGTRTVNRSMWSQQRTNADVQHAPKLRTSLRGKNDAIRFNTEAGNAIGCDRYPAVLSSYSSATSNSAIIREFAETRRATNAQYHHLVWSTERYTRTSAVIDTAGGTVMALSAAAAC